jgi:general secretion pathway protein M
MSLREQLEKLTPREQRMLAVLGVLFGLLLFVGVPLWLFTTVSSARAHNESIRDVLTRMDSANELLEVRRREREAQDLRHANPAPALATFIETAAKANGLEVPDTTDRPEVPGKVFTERVTQVTMRKVSLKPLVKMLEKMERSGHPVGITQLGIKKRVSAPDEYDVTMAVSAYDKKGALPKGEAAPKSKPKAPKGAETSKGREL